MLRYCLDQEQQAYDKLRAEWKTLAEDVRLICQKKWGQPDDTDSSYRMLNYCVDQETAAATKNAKAGFRW